MNNTSEDNCCCERIFDDVLEEYEAVIQKNLYQTSPQEREDLAQELRIKLFLKYRSITLTKKAPQFFQLEELG